MVEITGDTLARVEADMAQRNARALGECLQENAALRALLDACAPYLKEGETPAERIERERKDVTAMVGALARERTLLDQARKGLAEQAEVTSRVIAVITEARPYLESFAQLSRHPTAPDDVRKLLARLRELTHPSAGGGHDG